MNFGYPQRSDFHTGSGGRLCDDARVVWRLRRHSEPEPVVLPSLDRLSGLVDRVVELVEAVGDATPEAEPSRPPADGPEPQAVDVAWVAFVASHHGYRLLDGTGAAPQRGGVLELDGAPHRVVKIGPSPLPGDRRRCVYVERQEAPEAERTSDA